MQSTFAQLPDCIKTAFSLRLQSDHLGKSRGAITANTLAGELDRVIRRAAEYAACRILSYNYLIPVGKQLDRIGVRLQSEPAAKIFGQDNASRLVNFSDYS